MRALLLLSGFDFTDEWRAALAGASPDLAISLPHEPNAREAEIAIVHFPPAGELAYCPKLRAIFSLSAGIDTLLFDPALPDVPIVRLADAGMAARMREYVIYQVLRLHRRFAEIEANASIAHWRWIPAGRPASQLSITILGLGRLGLPCATALRNLGFQVAGWSRTEKQAAGIACYSGQGDLLAACRGADFLVCLLPLTSATHHILSRDLFAQLNPGAVLINVGRGGCLLEPDLLSALDRGQLAHATLDVVAEEPLPSTHPFWSDPRITVTPHIAADPEPAATAREIAEACACLRAGAPLPNLINRALGY